jgi:hypothetical protein
MPIVICRTGNFYTFDNNQNLNIMKKNYLFLLILLVFGLGESAFSQARPDLVSISGSTTGPVVVIQDVLANDSYEGMQASLSNVVFTESSSTASPYLTLDSNSGSIVFSGGPAPVGCQTLWYFCAGIDNPNNTQFAQVQVNVGCDVVSPPIITASNPNCSSNTLTFSGLPAGNWTIYESGTNIPFRSGNTPTVVATSVLGGDHLFQVANAQGCRSEYVAITNGFLSFDSQGIYEDTDANGIVNVGDRINYAATLTNVSTCAISNITATFNNPMVGGPLAGLAAGASDNSTFTYSHTITQTNINNGLVSRTFRFTGNTGTINTSIQKTFTNYLNQDNGMKLVAFIDTNGNGIMDGGEDEFNYGTFSYVVNDDGITHQLYTNPSHPTYLYETDPAISYDINFAVYGEYGPYYGMATASLDNITVPVGSGIVTHYFPLTFVPYNDLSVDLFGYGPWPRPGFTYQNKILVTNRGSQTADGTVTFTKSDTVTITDVSVTGTTPTATGFTYAFTGLLPGQSRSIMVTMQVPTIPTVSLGQMIVNNVSVSLPSADVNVNNNSDVLSQVIVGSYDPNAKTEKHGGKVLHSAFTADDFLTYKIEFENTGTFPAEFIRVVDELDDQLDETTVRMVDASHNYTLTRVGRTLTWMLDDIHLPPSVADTNIGHGYLVFKVKPKIGFALGDVIPNIANIYFDFNPPIVTDPCDTQFVNSLATTPFALDHFRYSPNPVKDNLSVSNDHAIDKISVTSVLGQVVLEKTVNDLDAVIDLSGLASGVYLIKATSLSTSKTFKILKE